MTTPRLAVLVDGDNISPRHADRVLSEAARRGKIDVARVYVAGLTPSDWLTAPGYRAIHAGGGKNASDILLCLDAMELALTGGIEAVVLVSSDRDFSHLALRLRERGVCVPGLGDAKAPDAFRRACTSFEVLPADPPSAPLATQGPTAFDIDIRNMIAPNSRQGRGISLKDLGNRMRAQHGTRIRTCPGGTWRDYLAARPHLFEVDPPGPQAMVRFLPEGFKGNGGA